jgi:protein TonB
MKANCREIHSLLGPYVDGELSLPDRARVETHLAECEAARHEVGELRALHSLVRDTPPPEPAEHFWDWQRMRVLRGLRSSRRRFERTEARPGFAWLRLATVAGGLMVVLIVVVVGWRLVMPGSIEQVLESHGQQAAAPAAKKAVEAEGPVASLPRQTTPLAPVPSAQAERAGSVAGGTASGRHAARTAASVERATAESRADADEMAAAGERSEVLVDVLVDSLGRPLKARIAGTSGDTELDNVALAASLRESLQPPRVSGRPAEGWVEVPYEVAAVPRAETPKRGVRPLRTEASNQVESRPQTRAGRPARSGSGESPAAEQADAETPAGLIQLPRREGEPDDTGTALLRILVEATGKASKVQIVKSSGSKDVDDFVTRLARNARYRPAQRSGKATRAWLELPITNTPPQKAKPDREDR